MAKRRDKSKEEWRKETLKLPEGHGWKSTPGYKVFVADRGALRFEFPQEWIVQPVENDIAIGLHDVLPPDDNVRLAVSTMHLRRDVDWSDLWLDTLVRQVFIHRERGEDDPRQVKWSEHVELYNRGDIEAAWAQGDFIDPQENRPARTIACLARGGSEQIVQAQLTMDFWIDDLAEREPIWRHVLNTLQLGQVIRDPLTHRDQG